MRPSFGPNLPQSGTHSYQKAIFKHALGMFSEALRILDQNTVKYMIEELQKQLEDEKAEKAAAIKEKDAEIAELKKQLEAVRPG